MTVIEEKRLRLLKLRELAPATVRGLAAAWDVRMVYESNSVENNTLTLRETEVVISKDFTSPGKPVTDYAEAKNLFRAWQKIRTKANRESDPSEADLLDSHEILTGSRHVGMGSHAVPNSNRIAAMFGGSGSEPEYLGHLFESLPLDPVERAASLHHRITQHSTFGTSSGQVARLAMNFVLLAAGYPPVSISPLLKTEYENALKAANSGDFPTWQTFITTRLDEEFDFWLDALSEPSATDH